jgi:phosphoribosylformylglycinamidine synthase
MGDACRALDFPIVSGNVSLYNESKATGGGSAILPTPAIGGVGLLDDWEKSATIGFKAPGEQILFIGTYRSLSLGQSLWLREIRDRSDGEPPRVDLKNERVAGEIVRALIDDGTLTAVHDLSDGGLAVAATEMALTSNLGAHIDVFEPSHEGSIEELLFGEGQGCYLVTVRTNDIAQKICKQVESAGLDFSFLGSVMEEPRLQFGDNPGYSGNVANIPLADLRVAHEGFFPKLMGADAALA